MSKPQRFRFEGSLRRIRTPDPMITNQLQPIILSISKTYRSVSLQNQQLVHAVRSTVSTREFRPVGQLVGQAAFRAESGLDDSDNRGIKQGGPSNLPGNP